MLLQMLLQVYYGQDDDTNTLPYLVGCAFIYFWYRFFTSSKSDSTSTKAKEKVADSETSTEVLASSTGEARAIENKSNSIEEMDARDYLAQAVDLADIYQCMEAIELVDKAISLDVQSLNPHLYNARGKILLTTMKYVGALKDFDRAIKLISARVGDNEKYLTEFTKNKTEAQDRIKAASNIHKSVDAVLGPKPKAFVQEKKTETETNSSAHALDETDDSKNYPDAFAERAAKAAAMFANIKSKQIEQVNLVTSAASAAEASESDDAKMKAEATAVYAKAASLFGNKPKPENYDSENDDDKATLEGMPWKEVHNEDFSTTLKATITKLQRNPLNANQTIVTTSAGHTLWLEESYLKRILADAFSQDLRPTVLVGTEISYEMKPYVVGDQAFDNMGKHAVDANQNPILHKTAGQNPINLKFGKIVGNFTELDKALIQAKENAQRATFGNKPNV